MFFSCVRFRDSSVTVYRWTYANICSTNRQWIKLASFFFKEQINSTWFFFFNRLEMCLCVRDNSWKRLKSSFNKLTYYFCIIILYCLIFFHSLSRDEMWKINHHAFNFGLKVYESPFWFFIRVFSGLFREEFLVFSFVF